MLGGIVEGSVLNLLAFRKALKDANCSVPDQMITQFFFSSDKLNKGYLDYPSILETIVVICSLTFYSFHM